MPFPAANDPATNPSGERTEELLAARRFRVVRHWQTLENGRVVVRETVQHPGAVVILPLVDADHLCLIRNYRIAVGQTLWELPAGTLEPDEDPAACAARELLEETGYHAARLEKLTELLMSPGILNERMHLFAAHDLTPGAMNLEPGEQITRHLVPWQEALAMIQRSEIQDAKTVAGILFYDRFRRTEPR